MNNINTIGHLEKVNSAIISFDKRFMITKAKNAIKVWDIMKGAELGTMMVTDENQNFGLAPASESIISWLVPQN